MTNKETELFKKGKKIIDVGLALDEIESVEDKASALIMLLTGFLIEEIKEECHLETLEDIAAAVRENIKEYKKHESNFELLCKESKGTA